MKRRAAGTAWRWALLLFGWAAALGAGGAAAEPVWGIDACLSIFVDRAEQRAYLPLLRESGVRVLRERGTPFPAADGSWSSDVRERLQELKAAGFTVVAFATLPPDLHPTQRGNALPEDLAAVYAGGRRLAELNAGIVDAWEMVGEPDVGYCRDLPDRVAAYQKALYLGIKAGGGEQGANRSGLTAPSHEPGAKRDERAAASSRIAPVVVMGALAGTPGPWLERAARNGLLDYTDAYNFHTYAAADGFGGVLRAHRAWLRRAGHADLPLWVTECGLNARLPAAPDDPARRRLQADFTVATAREARRQQVALYMPFILVHGDDPYALTLSADKVFPAWTAYAEYTREVSHAKPKAESDELSASSSELTAKSHQLRAMSYQLSAKSSELGAKSYELAAPSSELKAPSSQLKASGSQLSARPSPLPALRPDRVAPPPVVVQWLPDPATVTPRKVSGTYRFRDQGPIRGVLRWYNFGTTAAVGRWRSHGLSRFTASLPAELEVTIPPGGRVEHVVEFRHPDPAYRQEWFTGEWTDAAGQRSPLSFGLETEPDEAGFTVTPLPVGGAAPVFDRGAIFHDQTSSVLGPWTGLNGVALESLRPGGFRFHVTQLAGATFGDPLHPGFALARVDGLPREGFLRLRTDRPISRQWTAWVYLIDDRGRRFTIWENAGMAYGGSHTEIWLNLHDFSPWWENCDRGRAFDPRRVRAVMLRLDVGTVGQSREIQLDVLTPKPGRGPTR